MIELLHWVVDKIIAVIPGLLLRIVYSPKKVATQVRIELGGERPIAPSLNSSVPHIDLYMKIVNLSNIHLRLDRMLVDLWFGQPVLNGAILERTKIPARSADSELLFRSPLSSLQVRQIEPYLSDSPPSGPIALSVSAYFDSKIGLIEYQQRFERRAAQ